MEKVSRFTPLELARLVGLDTCYKEEYDRLGLLNHRGYYWSKE